MIRRAALGCFFCSGIAGLVYQIVWQRMLEQVFGATAYATATILAAFMAGLAIGSLAMANRADRIAHPLRWYGYIEGGICLFALAFPQLLSLLTPFLVSIQRSGIDRPLLLTATRTLFTGLLILVPATLMGTTLPLLSGTLIQNEHKRGVEFGWLYGLNTLGAVVGCLCAGFLSIRFLGVRESVYAAAGINGVVGIAAILLSYTHPQTPHRNAERTEGSTHNRHFASAALKNRAVLVVLGISGLCTFAYEVLWTRALVFSFTTSTYAFTTMLAAFLLSTAAGTYLCNLFVDRLRERERMVVFCAVQVLIGITALTTLWNFQAVDKWITLLTIQLGAGAGSFFVARFVLSLFVMAPPALLMGMDLPLGFRILSHASDGVGKSSGLSYGVNTAGCILGSLIAGFVLIPLYGVANGILIVSGINMITGLTVFVLTEFRNPKAMPVTVGVLLVAGAVMALTPRYPFIKNVGSLNSIPGTALLYYGEDHSGSSWVQKLPGGIRRLGVNANLMAENSRIGVLEHKLASHQPLLLHPNPQKMIAVGLGMGMTAYAALQHGVELDIAELCPSEIKAQEFFTDINHHVLKHPRAKLWITDGRNFLLKNKNTYDVIQIGITHPLASTGNAAFYTRDCYEMCRDALKEGGIVSQWIPIHDITLEDFRVLVRTFLEVFPHSVLFLNYFPDNCYLVGSDKSRPLSWQTLVASMSDSSVSRDLSSINMNSPYAIYGLCALDEKGVRELAGDGAIFTDNHPNIEFEAPLRKQNMFAEIVDVILTIREKTPPLVVDTSGASIPFESARADSFFRAANHILTALRARERRDLRREMHEYQAALLLTPQDSTAAYLFRQSYRSWCVLSGSNASRRGDYQTTLTLYEEALALGRDDPGQVELLTVLGWLYCAFDLDKAESHLREALSIAPEHAPAHFNYAQLMIQKKNLSLGKTYLENVLRLDPRHREARKLLRSLE